jgi:glycoprotein endo-alpha-1,2-mannosidase
MQREVAPVARALLAIAFAALLFSAGALGAPKVSIFYYPWYGTPSHDGQYVHWLQNGHSPPADIAANFYPARGVYSSSDPAVIRSEMGEMKAAGVDEVVASWWGRGSAEDKRLPAIITAAKREGLSVAAHLEPYSGRTVASTVSDIGYLRTLGITRFFVYQPLDFPGDDWAVANASLQGVQVFAQTVLVGIAALGRFDGIYTYDVLTYGGDKFARLCAQAHKRKLLCLPSVGPGFDARRATGERRVKPRRNGATYDSMWRAAVAARPDGVTITSYNEWHEGTQIEPASAKPGSPYTTYAGAWGKQGAAATRAYLTRTAHWARLFRLKPAK